MRCNALQVKSRLSSSYFLIFSFFRSSTFPLLSFLFSCLSPHAPLFSSVYGTTLLKQTSAQFPERRKKKRKKIL
ncbi:hypothetical protein L873DRAFT_1804602 [Choiromyces venosus 120613-1]|uniref:Uncharacterized protein n=1 Tax=Choiromyces venosus 120613-1 TaxID=1336337 RepID=A0A3N4JXI0_9PEZI|nr:hypothetical protein L873DRAFT_1804602 [Choiromyces venosus 120613-1]